MPRIPALIIVDLQEDFCPPNGSLAISSGRDIAPALNALLSRPLALKVATQDWHPPDSKTFASTHGPADLEPAKSTYTGANPSDASHTETWTVWPDHCVRDTPGAAVIPELDASRVDVFLKKGLDADAEVLSGFGDVFGRRGPAVADADLAALLRDKGVTDVLVGGLVTDFCVKATALDAAREGFATYFLADCARPTSRENGEKAEAEMRDAGVRVTQSTSEEVREMLAAYASDL